MPPPGPPAHSHRGQVRSVVGHLVPACISAAMLGLAYPSPGWGLLAHVALVPWVLLAIRSVSVKRLAWTSYFVALAWCLVMYRWLYPVTGGGYVAVCIYLAIHTTAAILLTRWLHRRLGSAMVLTLPLAWVTCEYVRCHFIEGGFPWFALGHTQASFTPTAPDGNPGQLVQIADLFGQHGVSFLVAMTNGIIVDLLTRPLIRRDDHAAPAGVAPASPRARGNRYLQAAFILWLAAFVSAWFYGHHRLGHPPQSQRSIRVAVIQTNVPQSNKDSTKASTMKEEWNALIDLTMRAATEQPAPELIIWPETIVPASLNREAMDHYAEIARDYDAFDKRYFHDRTAQLARDNRVALLAGSSAEYDYKPVTVPGGVAFLPSKRYNSAFLYHADGTQDEQRYDKVHRVPFGEYRPWVEGNPTLDKLFLKYLTPYEFDYSIKPGTKLTVFELPGAAPAATQAMSPASQASWGVRGSTTPVRFATPICFEDVTPEVTREMVYTDLGRKRADMLVNITNDGWYPGADQGVQHLQIATLRCIELRVPMARSVNTGVSAFIDSSGRIGPQVEVNGQRQLVAGYAATDMVLDGRETLYGRIGDWPIYGMMMLTAALAAGALLVKRR